VERLYLVSTPDLPATLAISEPVGYEAAGFASRFLRRGINGTDVIPRLKGMTVLDDTHVLSPGIAPNRERSEVPAHQRILAE